MTGRGDFAAVCWARVPEALQALSVHTREQGPGESERPVRVSAGQLQAQAEWSLGHRPKESLGV